MPSYPDSANPDKTINGISSDQSIEVQVDRDGKDGDGCDQVKSSCECPGKTRRKQLRA
jgi:hypothetical protein